MGSPDVADRHLVQGVLTHLGQELAAERLIQGYTAYSLGKVIGVSQSAVYRVENGLNHRLGPIVKVADALGFDVEIHLVRRP